MFRYDLENVEFPDDDDAYLTLQPYSSDFPIVPDSDVKESASVSPSLSTTSIVIQNLDTQVPVDTVSTTPRPIVFDVDIKEQLAKYVGVKITKKEFCRESKIPEKHLDQYLIHTRISFIRSIYPSKDYVEKFLEHYPTFMEAYNAFNHAPLHRFITLYSIPLYRFTDLAPQAAKEKKATHHKWPEYAEIEKSLAEVIGCKVTFNEFCRNKNIPEELLRGYLISKKITFLQCLYPSKGYVEKFLEHYPTYNEAYYAFSNSVKEFLYLHKIPLYRFADCADNAPDSKVKDDRSHKRKFIWVEAKRFGKAI